jgi:hypothetical protein
LITTGTQTIAGTKTFSDATKNNGGIFLQNASSSSLAGYMNLGGLTNGVKFTSGGGVSNSFTLPSATGYTFTFPNATGTIALTSDISYPVTSVFGRTGAVVATSGDYTTAQVTESGNLYFTDSRARLALSFVAGSGAYNSTTGVITIPTDNNQIANGSGFITSSALSGYVTLAGTQTITGAKTFSTFTKFDGGVILKNNVSASLAGYVGLSAYSASGNKGINIDFDTYSIGFYFNGTLPYNYTFPNANGTVALTSDIPDVSGYVTLITAQTITGAKTFTSALAGTSGTFSGILQSSGGDIRSAGTAADSVTAGPFISIRNASNAYQYLLQLNATYGLDFWTFGGSWNKRMTLDGSGNLGVGTPTPSGIFQAGVANAGIYFDVTTTYTPKIKAAGTISDLQIESVGSGGNMVLGAPGATSVMQFFVNGTLGTGERMRIFSDGNVLIQSGGTFTNNGYKLDVNGTGRFSGNVSVGGTLGVGTVAPQSKFEVQNGNAGFYNPTASSGGAQIYLGDMNFAGGAYATSAPGIGSVASPQTSVAGDLAFYVYASSAGSRSEVMRIIRTSTGNRLGIGTTTPVTDVDINAAITGAYTTSSSQAPLRIFNVTNAGGINSSFISLQCSTDNSASNPVARIGVVGETAGSNNGAMVMMTRDGSGVIERMRIASTGAITCTSSVTATSFFESSDNRLKTLIQDNYQTKGIASITPKLYTKNGKVELGYYAQDLVGVLDSAVSKGSDDMLSLSYREVLVAKVYALEQRIKELENK